LANIFTTARHTGTEHDGVNPEKKEARVFNTTLALTGLEYGVAKAESQCQFDSTKETKIGFVGIGRLDTRPSIALDYHS
jgi:hypothetical protein